MKKTKYRRFITRDQIEDILLAEFPKYKCPTCGKFGVCASAIEDEYDENHDDFVVLSFTPICQNCGDVLGGWDNTYRTPFLGRKDG